MPMISPRPVVGDWYRFIDGETFEVVALDEEEATIEIQYFDGTVEELDFDEWRERADAHEIEAAAEPEDWSGSMDVDPDDDSVESRQLSS
jgi:hypothetical protein